MAHRRKGNVERVVAGWIKRGDYKFPLVIYRKIRKGPKRSK